MRFVDSQQRRFAQLVKLGYKRGGQALRCVGDDFEPRAFNVFAPVVLAGIGGLPGTLHDRSIVTRMERAKTWRNRCSVRLTTYTKGKRNYAARLRDGLRIISTLCETREPQLPETAFNPGYACIIGDRCWRSRKSRVVIGRSEAS